MVSENVFPIYREVNRLTLITTVHYEHGNEQPMSIQSSYSTLLENDEDSYSRRYKVSQEWVGIDFGFVQPHNVGLIIVENLVGKERQVNPTPEEAKQDQEKVLLVKLHPQDLGSQLVPPGQHLILHPTDPQNVRLKCKSGIARCRTTIMPR